MSVVVRRQHPIWEIIPFESIAVLATFLVVVLGIFKAADDTLRAATLRALASDEPARSVLLVTLKPEQVRQASCEEDVARLLASAKAKATVFLPLSAQLCRSERTALTTRRRVIERSSILSDREGRITGFAPSATWLSEIGGPHDAEWISATFAPSVPEVTLGDLASGKVPSVVLTGRVAVVGLDDSLTSSSAEPSAREVAAAVAAALEGRTSKAVSDWIAALLSTLCAAGVAISYRKRGFWLCTITLIASFLLAVAAFVICASAGRLISLVSISFGLLSCAMLLALPRIVAARRAISRATELIERAALMRSQTVHAIPDPEFWARIAGLAEQAHPADEVLVAELPPHKWHLKFWSNGKIGESAISERRRDVRRTPYVNDEGVPMIRVVRNYLVMKDVPVLVVPLMALGELEGYVFLCGARAERAFAENPELAPRMAKDLALLIRRRRLGSLQENDWRRTAGALVQHPSEQALSLIEGARVALDDLRLFSSMIREAPVGLLYADSFGDVRILGKALAKWLPRFGIHPPASATDGLLPVGSLQLSAILSALTKDTALKAPPLASIAQASDGITLRIQALPEEGDSAIPTGSSSTLAAAKPSPTLVLRVRGLFNQSDGASTIAGYVGSLVEVETVRSSDVAKVERLPGVARGELLSVFSLSELVGDVAQIASRRSGKAVRFEPPRSLATVAGNRQSLAAALEEFLVDSAARAGAERGPVLAISERNNKVELSILDLQLGLPSATLKRTVQAPSEAPDGLDALGALVIAVEDSLGNMSVRTEDGWGITLSCAFVKARPRVSRPSKDGSVVVDMPKRKGRN